MTADPKDRHLRAVPDGPPLWPDDEHPGGGGPGDVDRRHEVRLGSDSFQNVQALDDALAHHDPDVFQRALQLVEVVAERKPGLSPIGAPILRPLGKHSLETRVSQHLRCMKWEEGAKEARKAGGAITLKHPIAMSGAWVPARASAETAIYPMLAFGRWQHIQPITGIAESPVFRPDGTVCQVPGYDGATGYLYRPSAEYPPIPDHPSQDDARLAIESLRHVFCDFPYVTPAMGYVPIAALLTILARAAITGPVPVFAFEASIQGSGKTKQGDCAHIIATGRFAPKSSFPPEEAEQAKTIFACAVSASPVAFFDNVKGEFGGAPLEGVITTSELRQRVLGATEFRSIPWVATTIVTGNNMTMTDDMLRRSLFCRIEPNEEDPTKRTAFEHPDLEDWTMAERSRLMVAALTVLRAYACHGYPDTGTGIMQSFNAWSRLVPQAIKFAGGGNVLECIGNTEARSTDSAAAFATLVRELPRLSPGPIKAKAILDAVYPAPRKDEAPDGWDELRDAIETLAPSRGPYPPDPVRFALAMKKREGQVSQGRKLVSELDRVAKVRRWCVR